MSLSGALNSGITKTPYGADDSTYHGSNNEKSKK
jgi:hypothetical protein